MHCIVSGFIQIYSHLTPLSSPALSGRSSITVHIVSVLISALLGILKTIDGK